MEHRLILGGEQYLPFARSRVKTLKALGLNYVDQAFEIDGVSIRVRIEPGHEYIRIEGGSTLEMDSGVVDLGNIGYENPARFLPGQLYGTDYYKSYTMGFTVVKGDWKTNPSDTKQVAGKLTYPPGVKGAIRPDAFNAISFMPKSGEAADEALYMKKLVTTACPASMFTGKCRLYVQAMYGRPLHLGGIANGLTLGSGAGQRPWLKINSFDTVGGESTVIGITTDSGVYLDKLTGNHYLISLSNHSGTAYPLKATAPVEKLRSRLVGFYAGTSVATEEDTEHLEAYILSDCMPVYAQRQNFSFNETKPVWSLGYGWHWNWSGTKANFVYTEAYTQTGSTEFDLRAASRSTHFQLDVSFNNGVFSAVSSVIRGPTDWTLVPSNWCVLEPDWGSGSASKLTQPRTNLMACSADFYAYYNRDQLVRCSVTISEIDDTSDNFEEFTPYWFGQYGGHDPNYAATWGLRDGHYNGRTSGYGKAYKAHFTFGSLSADNLYYNRSYSTLAREIKNKVMGDLPTTILYDYGLSFFSGSVLSGYPPYTITYYPAMTPDEAIPPYVDFDYRKYTRETSFYSYMHAIVPFCDAEAMLVRCESHQYEIYKFDTVGRYQTGGSVKLWRPKISDDGLHFARRGEHVQFVLYGMQQPLGSPTVIIPPQSSGVPDENIVLTSLSVALAGGTRTPAVIPDAYEYRDINTTNVGVHYEVRSGVREGDEAVVIARSIEAQKGTDHVFSNPTIVGWV